MSDPEAIIAELNGAIDNAIMHGDKPNERDEAIRDTIETLTRRLAEVTAERDKEKADAQFFAGLLSRFEEDADDDAVEKAEAERDDLRLAILGGEDAPGSASDVTIARTIKYLDDERSLNQDLLETAEAERDALRAACVAAREVLDGSYDGLGIDAAISVLDAVLGERDEG